MFKMKRTDFLKLLDDAMLVVPKRANNDLDHYVVLEAGDGFMKLHARDGGWDAKEGLRLTALRKCDASEAAPFAVLAEDLRKHLRASDADTITVRQDPERGAVVEEPDGTTAVFTSVVDWLDDFLSPLPDMPGMNAWMEPAPFLHALNKVALAMADEVIRPYLNSIAVHGELEMAATDGHVLHHVHMNVPVDNPLVFEEGKEDGAAIIPREFVRALLRSKLLKGAERLRLCTGDGVACVIADTPDGTLRFDTGLIDARYPWYPRVVPLPDEDAMATTDKLAELVAFAKRAKAAKAVITCEVCSDELRLSYEAGSATVSRRLPAKVNVGSGLPLTVNMRASYLFDALRGLDDNVVRLYLGAVRNGGPVRLQGLSDDTFYAVMMPVQHR